MWCTQPFALPNNVEITSHQSDHYNLRDSRRLFKEYVPSLRIYKVLVVFNLYMNDQFKTLQNINM